jgi:uncharacterized protein (TIGR03437 family)
MIVESAEPVIRPQLRAMKRFFRDTLGPAAILVLLCTHLLGQCGVERWPVKTGTDSDSRLVNLSLVSSTSIGMLTAVPAPSSLPESSRIQPTETTVFALNATLTEFKLESDDSDYHLVLSDSAGRTMIVEIPAPNCVGSASPFLPAISNARAQFDARFKATTSFKTANIPVQIKGVGFFDFKHGQTGVAPNAIELHPVLDIVFNPSTSISPTITSVNTVGGSTDIAQNTWIEVRGNNLVPSSVPSSGLTWGSAPEFKSGRMPTQLSGVGVRVNGKSAYVYYISPSQINVLTPLDSTLGSVQIVATSGTASSSPFTANLRAVAPSFIPIDGSTYAVATHADGSLVGPGWMSAPGYTFTPAEPRETIVLYAFGFGLPTTLLIDGSSSQAGSLPTAPSIQIGGTTVAVLFAGVISPGLYQFNVTVPMTVGDGDNSLVASYGGLTTPTGAVITVQRR